MADAPSAAQFEALIGERFTVGRAPMTAPPTEPAEGLALELTEVSERGTGFALTFRGPAASPLPQATYRFERGDDPPRDIFIVPVGGDGETAVYEAIFA